MSFATAVNCMDGRVQEPVTAYIRNASLVDYVDMVTVPGPDKVLSEGIREDLLSHIRDCISISVTKHGSQGIYLAAHHDCAANPADREAHLDQLGKGVALLRSWFPGLKVTALWVDADGAVEEIQ